MDANEEQLKQCKPQPNITFQKACAEDCGLPSSSLDLVTVATALHWCTYGLLPAMCLLVLLLSTGTLCKKFKQHRQTDALCRLH